MSAAGGSFKESNICLLTNDKATRQAIYAGIKSLKRRATQTTSYLYISEGTESLIVSQDSCISCLSMPIPLTHLPWEYFFGIHSENSHGSWRKASSVFY